MAEPPLAVSAACVTAWVTLLATSEERLPTATARVVGLGLGLAPVVATGPGLAVVVPPVVVTAGEGLGLVVTATAGTVIGAITPVVLPVGDGLVASAPLGLGLVVVAPPAVEVTAGAGEVLISVVVWLRAVEIGTTTTPPVALVALAAPPPTDGEATGPGLGEGLEVEVVEVEVALSAPGMAVKAGSGEVLMVVEVWLRAVVTGTTTMVPLSAPVVLAVAAGDVVLVSVTVLSVPVTLAGPDSSVEVLLLDGLGEGAALPIRATWGGLLAVLLTAAGQGEGSIGTRTQQLSRRSTNMLLLKQELQDSFCRNNPDHTHK